MGLHMSRPLPKPQLLRLPDDVLLAIMRMSCSSTSLQDLSWNPYVLRERLKERVRWARTAKAFLPLARILLQEEAFLLSGRKPLMSEVRAPTYREHELLQDSVLPNIQAFSWIRWPQRVCQLPEPVEDGNGSVSIAPIRFRCLSIWLFEPLENRSQLWLKSLSPSRLTSLNLDVRLSGVRGVTEVLNILSNIGACLKAIRINMDRIRHMPDEDVEDWSISNTLRLPCVHALWLNLGRCVSSQILLREILGALKQDQLLELHLYYPRRVHELSPLPLTILSKCGKQIRKLGLYLNEALSDHGDTFGQSSTSSHIQATAGLKDICPHLETVSLNRLNRSSAGYIAHNFKVLRLDCTDLTYNDYSAICAGMGTGNTLEKILLRHCFQAGSLERLEVQRLFRLVGWNYQGASACQEALLFTRDSFRCS